MRGFVRRGTGRAEGGRRSAVFGRLVRHTDPRWSAQAAGTTYFSESTQQNQIISCKAFKGCWRWRPRCARHQPVLPHHTPQNEPHHSLNKNEICTIFTVSELRHSDKRTIIPKKSHAFSNSNAGSPLYSSRRTPLGKQTEES
jgi:hypothetical protein